MTLHPSRNAVTLTELLVSLVVVAALLVLFFPVGNRILANAQTNRCVSILRSWHHGFTLFAADNENQIPPYRVVIRNPNGTTSNGDAWTPYIRPYLADEKALKMHRCPVIRSYKVYYGMNARFSEVFTKLTAVPLPAKQYLLTESKGANWTRVTAEKFYDDSEIPNGEGPSEAAFQHFGGKANILFLDGHVESRTSPEIPNRRNGHSGTSAEYLGFFQGKAP